MLSVRSVLICLLYVNFAFTQQDMPADNPDSGVTNNKEHSVDSAFVDSSNIGTVAADTLFPADSAASRHIVDSPAEKSSPEDSAKEGGVIKKTASTEAESSDTLLSLDKIVVTATRTRRRISQTPASVSVVSRDEIEISSAKDINDLIANKTGVQVRRYVGMGEGVPSDIIMRGIPGALAATRTLILVDGIPTNASGTPFLILNEIPVEIIDNIEIVRGPYSSLYGANAFGGVINVVTKKGDGRPSGSAMFETSWPFSVADAWWKDNPIGKAAKMGAHRALWNGDLMSSAGNGKIDYLVNAGYRYIGNYLLDDSALVSKIDTSYLIPARNYDYGDLRFFGRFGWRPNNSLSIELHSRYFKSNLGFGYTRYTAPDTVDINIKGEKIIAGPQIQWKVNDRFDLKAGGYIRRLIGYYSNEMNRRPIEWESRSNDWQVELQGVLRPISHNVLTFGVEMLTNTIAFGDIVDILEKNSIEKGTTDRIRNGGAYLQDEIDFMERFRIVPGIRLDYHTVFGMAVSPKLGALVSLNEYVRLRSSMGRAFRAPNLSELFMQPLPLREKITIRSNPDLQPEYILAVDGGADFTPKPNIKISWGLFYNRMKDLIAQGIKLENDGDLYITHDNISSAWSAGNELDIEWRLIPQLRLTGSYVFQHSRNESASDMAAYFKKKLKEKSGVEETDVPLDYIPAHKGGFGVMFTKKIGSVALSVSADELFVGRRSCQRFEDIGIGTSGPIRIFFDPSDNTIKVNPPVAHLPSYSRTDLSLRAEFGTRLWVMISIQNCFNAQYEESFGTFAPKRLASVKVGSAF